MCNCEEIQGNWPPLALGGSNWFAILSKGRECKAHGGGGGNFCSQCGKKMSWAEGEWLVFHSTDKGAMDIWLPRQDQLQGVLGVDFPHLISIDWTSWVWHTYTASLQVWERFTSMEQLWLAFVMKEKFNKIWNGEVWEYE